MRVAVSGSHGLIGSALVARLSGEGAAVSPLHRGPYTPAQVEGVDAVVHLAGASIGGRRWNEEYKRQLRASRIDSTASLARAVAGVDGRRPVLVTASAVGYYGADRGALELTENDGAGTDFLARLCVDWESAADPARHAGARVVHARFGLVLSAAGGVFGRQLPLFRAGMGGRLGRGEQYQSWITRRDAVSALERLIADDGASGPFNVTAPAAVTNRELTSALGRAMRRPTFLTVPAFALRAAFGREMAEVAPLASQRVVPARLRDAGFRWADPDLAGGIATALADRP